ncbi:CCHC-type domain-containing protein [Aphis craccivora]|uniref:CCHC-type domain-containing protein n=1 Tax=Aphis craccivora TaxID=307492 RepID=A0A6G0WBV6_APHCR|nr:CCHC-type domain-containing protein [Aphis craccivora]
MPTDNENSIADLVAPSYNELYSAVIELREKLRVLQTSSNPNPNPEISSVVPPSVDYRILPDIGTSIWTFTGHETSSQADDWVPKLR